MRTRLLSLAVACLLAVAALALAACGSDSSSSSDLGPDPATMTPADTPFYMEAVLRPEGDLSDNLESALGKLLVTDDVSGKIHDALDQSLAENGGHFTYENDIAPWLGTRAGFFVNGYDSRDEEVEGAAVVAVTDADAAQSFVDKAAAEGKEKTRQQDYKGVQLTVSSDDTAVGIDGDFLLAGSMQGVEDAIDAADGDDFAGVDDSTTGLDEVPDDTVFSLYADPQKALDLVRSSGAVPADQLKQIEDQLAGMSDGPIDAWGSVTDSSFSFGASAPAAEDAPDPTDLLTTLPADSWLAFAAGDVGDQIASSIAQFKAGFEAGLQEAAPRAAAQVDPVQAFQDATGLNLEQDLAWIGDVGGFVQGTSIFGLGGGLVITTDDTQAAEGAVSKLQGALG
ncbi:MAG TPA: DUF3352 domain-containing protein [Solirubrobacterales bacterium]|nr:DUF3352 domain-containing protein [Solirubrobacterales bacterium]